MRREGKPLAGAAPHFAALHSGRLPEHPALVFVPAERLPHRHPDFRTLRPGEERARNAAAGAHGAARPEDSPGFIVPSDTELGLRPGAAQQCAAAVVAMLRGQQLVSAS